MHTRSNLGSTGKASLARLALSFRFAEFTAPATRLLVSTATRAGVACALPALWHHFDNTAVFAHSGAAAVSNALRVISGGVSHA